MEPTQSEALKALSTFGTILEEKVDCMERRQELIAEEVKELNKNLKKCFELLSGQREYMDKASKQICFYTDLARSYKQLLEEGATNMKKLCWRLQE